MFQKRSTAAWLAEKMTKDSHAVALLTGELQIEQRAAIIKRFRDGKEKVLITTNVSARGCWPVCLADVQKKLGEMCQARKLK